MTRGSRSATPHRRGTGWNSPSPPALLEQNEILAPATTLPYTPVQSAHRRQIGYRPVSRGVSRSPNAHGCPDFWNPCAIGRQPDTAGYSLKPDISSLCPRAVRAARIVRRPLRSEECIAWKTDSPLNDNLQGNRRSRCSRAELRNAVTETSRFVMNADSRRVLWISEDAGYAFRLFQKPDLAQSGDRELKRPFSNPLEQPEVPAHGNRLCCPASNGYTGSMKRHSRSD